MLEIHHGKLQVQMSALVLALVLEVTMVGVHLVTDGVDITAGAILAMVTVTAGAGAGEVITLHTILVTTLHTILDITRELLMESAMHTIQEGLIPVE